MWLTKFKIALVEKDIDKLSKLMNNLPELETKKEMQEAQYLIKEATSLVHTLKNETSSSMKQIKKNLEFLKSTEAPKIAKLDIKL